MDAERYKRNIQLPEIGTPGQERLLKGSVMTVGCGALGSVIATYLCASGIGRIGIADFDTIDISNLQRQVFYSTSQQGKPKSECLQKHLSALNPDTAIDLYDFPIRKENASEIFRNYDVIIDGSDNPLTKYMVASVCSILMKPYIIGGVDGFKGQVTVFTDHQLSYCDIFCNAEKTRSSADTSKGVFGPTAGSVGCMAAAQALKLIAIPGSIAGNSIWTADLLTMEFNSFSI